MLGRALLRHILDNDRLTRGLADPEARILIEWLVEQAELIADETLSEKGAEEQVRQRCRRARGIAQFVRLWCHEKERGAACQLAAAERFSWPLPTTDVTDPCELMHSILEKESEVAADSWPRLEPPRRRAA
ncbi:MAG: hypothetical protein KatS3mg105_3615 [Gemmatales bacterium]|nr:MAG: hypothetical protein KatS3mg105_3615 [Gemmatales bacterium]